MAKKPATTRKKPIGEVLRAHRVETLKKGLRETAELLKISAPHLTDIEKGRRSPSEDLLLRIFKVYGIAEAELRSAWSKPDGIVGEIASQDATTAKKVPEFLRNAKDLSPQQWDKLIEQAKRMNERPERPGR